MYRTKCSSFHTNVWIIILSQNKPVRGVKLQVTIKHPLALNWDTTVLIARHAVRVHTCILYQISIYISTIIIWRSSYIQALAHIKYRLMYHLATYTVTYPYLYQSKHRGILCISTTLVCQWILLLLHTIPISCTLQSSTLFFFTCIRQAGVCMYANIDIKINIASKGSYFRFL